MRANQHKRGRRAIWICPNRRSASQVSTLSRRNSSRVNGEVNSVRENDRNGDRVNVEKTGYLVRSQRSMNVRMFIFFASICIFRRCNKDKIVICICIIARCILPGDSLSCSS